MRIIKISQRNYKYVVDAGIDPQTGKRRRISKSGFIREKDARAAGREAETRVDRGQVAAPRKMRFSSLAAEWLPMYEALGKKPSSVRIRKHYIEILNEAFGEFPLQTITKKAYQGEIFALAKRFSQSTLEGIHSTARMIFKEAMKERLIYEDPTLYAVLPRPAAAITEETPLPHYLEKDELLRFLSAAKEHGLFGDYELFTTLAYTGLRIGEALALTWNDVDLDAQTLRVNKTLYNPENNKNTYTFVAPKTARSRRVLDLDAHTVSVLSAYQAELGKLRLLCGSSWYVLPGYPGGFVFPSVAGYGAPMSQKLVQGRINRLIKKMDDPPALRITPHVFRHTHASLLAEAGVGLEEIQNRLGHANDDTTRLIYLHITETRKRDAVDRFAAFLGQ